MDNPHPRALGLGIDTESKIFSVSSIDLFNAIAEEVDLETVTDHELREIFFIVRRQLAHLAWKDLVSYAVTHLPFGLNQTGIAFDGGNPCTCDCPDAMIEDDNCYHRHACKAWEIYEARL